MSDSKAIGAQHSEGVGGVGGQRLRGEGGDTGSSVCNSVHSECIGVQEMQNMTL